MQERPCTTCGGGFSPGTEGYKVSFVSDFSQISCHSGQGLLSETNLVLSSTEPPLISSTRFFLSSTTMPPSLPKILMVDQVQAQTTRLVTQWSTGPRLSVSLILSPPCWPHRLFLQLQCAVRRCGQVWSGDTQHWSGELSPAFLALESSRSVAPLTSSLPCSPQQPDYLAPGSGVSGVSSKPHWFSGIAVR